MVRRTLSLCLLVAVATPMRSAAITDAATADAAVCCCCPAGACECGCQAPAKPVGTDPSTKDAPGNPQFCACDGTPLALPLSGPSVSHRLALAGSVPAVSHGVKVCRLCARFYDYLPHGPPTSLAAISAIILVI